MTKNKKLLHSSRSRRLAMGHTPNHITVTIRTPSGNAAKNSPYARHRVASHTPLRFRMTEEEDEEESQRSGVQQEAMGSPTLAAATEADAEAPTLPLTEASYCVRQTVPSHAMFALTKVASLLQYVAPGALVAFDIDDTLVKKRHFSCSLLTTEGTRAFHLHIQQHLSSLPFTEKQRLVNALHQEVKAFTLAEDETAQVVRALQARGARVFGLTARSSSMAAATATTLTELGIDLAASAPASLPRRAIEPTTGAAVVDGVVYCNDVDKGVVFQRLLQQGWISWTAPVAAPAAQCGAAVAQQQQQQQLHEHTEDGGGCPERTVWFVDDSLAMINGMVTAWVQMAHAQTQLYESLGAWTQQIPCRGKLALVCCHYTHPTAAATAATPADATAGIVTAQIAEFLASGAIISDAEALQRIAAAGSSAAAAAAAVPATAVAY
jgi:hypothetical protein